MTKVLNMRDKPPRGIYVGRPTKWGNPFRMRNESERELVIAKYERWIAHEPKLLMDMEQLRGHDLICWCAPKACHADVLLRLASMAIDERMAWAGNMKKEK